MKSKWTENELKIKLKMDFETKIKMNRKWIKKLKKTQLKHQNTL